MATAVQQRRGTATQHDDGSGFTGLEGEITVDTTNDTIRVHDNSTKGGHRLAKYSELGATITASDESSDVECFPVFTTAATGALAPKTDASAYTYNAGTGTLSVTALNVNGTVTADGLTLGDNEKIAINSNLEIYTNGNDSYIQEKDASGALFIEGQNFFGRDKDQKNRLSWDNDNVRLYFKNDTASTINAGLATEVTAGESGERLRTQAGGIDVTGEVKADSLNIDGAVDIDTGNAFFDVNTGTHPTIFRSSDTERQFIIICDSTTDTAAPDLVLRREGDVSGDDAFIAGNLRFEAPVNETDTSSGEYTTGMPYAIIQANVLDQAAGLNTRADADASLTFSVQDGDNTGATKEPSEKLKVYKDGINVTGTVTADAYTGSQTISNYVTDTAIDVTEFASYAGKKIIYTGAASTISLPNVVAADIGKSWTIVNAGTGVITVDVDASGTAQQVRHAHAGGVNTSTTDRTIAIGGVVEIICIAEDSSGITNSSDKPNYLIYGGGVI